MNLDQARKMKIEGYEHPNSSSDENFLGNALVGGRGKIYKTFSDSESKKTFGTTVVGNNNYSKIESINNKDGCPVCSLSYKYVCNCIYNDKTCDNGHIWYTDREGNVKTGNPHKR